MAHSRIDDLRRRVEADPASIAFAQLAEEYRRAGQTEEAVRICRDGLTRHPGYLSARVTLGRALLDLAKLDEARAELQFVASEAPENLAAVRGLAEIFHREGDLPAALEHFQRALSLARHDPELEEIVQQLSRQVGAEAGSSNGLTFEEAHQELLSAAERVPLVAAAAPAVLEPEPEPAVEAAPLPTTPAAPATAFDFDTLVAALGTPPAPPLVEAVVGGETPEVFTLPDLPAEGGDPFAVLEAELRAQGDIGAAALDDQMAALVAGDAAPAEVAVAEPAADDWPGEMAERLPADVEATPAPGEEPPTDAPWLTTRLDEEAAPEPAPVVEWGYAEAIVADAPPTTSSDQPAAPAEPVLVVEGAFHLEVPAMPSDEPVAPAEGSGDPLLAGVEAALPAELETDAVGPEAVEQLMTGLAAAVEPPPAVAQAPADAPAATPEPSVVTAPAAQGDDVLGDLEDWLSTLQERSSSQ